MTQVPRIAADRLAELAGVFRVVVVHGPRQAGKTTLLRQYQAAVGGSFTTLDDPASLSEALADPVATASRGAPPRMIDEVQRGRDPLLLAIKRIVDEQPGAGRFVLAGSTNFLTTRAVSESLAGRAVALTVWPLSLAERTGASDPLDLLGLRERALAGGDSPWTREQYVDLVCAGGFPEPLGLPERMRRFWFDSYLDAVIVRDIAELAHLQRTQALPRLLGMIAARSGSGIVVADLARALALSPITTANYLGYLETVFLTQQLPAWSTSIHARAARTPRTFLTDSGLASHVLGATPDSLATSGPALGPLVESFVMGELVRVFANDPQAPSLSYYRDPAGREIDIVAEHRDGTVAALEVKASSSPSGGDARHLAWLRDKLGDRFAAGLVLHLGPRSFSLGDRLAAVPVSALWQHRRLPAR